MQKLFEAMALFVMGPGLVSGLAAGAVIANAEATTMVANALRVDATTPMPPVGPAAYHGGTDRAPDGTVLGETDRYLTLGGKPWIPVMGEMHYARVPEAEWDEDLAKLKAAGVDAVSTYVIWIYHEEVQGDWDWSGNRDLRHFAELCQKHGLMLMVRVGPWAHAETRNGGLPDWVMKAGPTRQTDPKFMAETSAFYDQIGMQLKGLLWKDGGPVAGVQIENEYGQQGSGKGAEYILALKSLALKAGLDVPLYTVTGWDNAVVPPGEFLPVFGGYPAAPWGGTTAKLPPQEVYAFRFNSRVSGNMGMIGTVPPANGDHKAAPVPSSAPATPFLTAEIGGGIQDTYHRRPVISADDIAAMAPVMLGSGVNGYGTYMMVGGQDAVGKLSTFQESQVTGYPTDVPVKSYDFQAPIGEFGRERRSLRLLKEWNYFMQDFGPLLAPMPVFAPAIRPRDPQDLSVLRWSVRTNGHAGFVFVNNYVRGTTMPARQGVQFAVALPQKHTATIPDKPIDIPSGASFAWPFGLRFGGGIELRYATAQLMSVLPGSGDTTRTHVLFCVKAVRCELSLNGDHLSVQAPLGIQVERSAGTTRLTREAGAADMSVINLHSSDASVRVILLSSDAAEETWRLPVAGTQKLVRTRADIWADTSGLVLQQLGDSKFSFSVFASAADSFSAKVPVAKQPDGEFHADLPTVHIEASLQQERPAGTVPPVHLGPALSWRPVGVAQAPDDQIWSDDAGKWRLHLDPSKIPGGAGNVFLRIQYAGDEGRLVGPSGKLLADNYWNGEPWLVGLRRFASTSGELPDIQLHFLPIRADAPIFLSTEARTEMPSSGQMLKVKSVEAIPEYQLRVSAATRPDHP